MKVAIIGGGIAGLTAAVRLQDEGHAVRVFDKGRRVGGRASTRIADDGRLSFDHGAQYFTARSSAFRAQTEQWRRAGVVKPWAGRIGVAEDGRVQTKADNPERFVGTPGMSALAEDLADGVPVESAIRVAHLRRRPDGWRLMDDAHRVYDGYDSVLVAVPPAQAATLVESSPELTAACATAPIAPCWAVMVSFVVRLPQAHDGIFFADGPLRWAARDSSKPHRIGGEAWVLHASDDWSRAHLDAAPEEVVAALLEAFFSATGVAPHAPAFVHAHRWRYATPDPALEDGVRLDAEARLALAGDWLMGARVEGAFLSGLAAAEAIGALP